jgi:L-tartrate/succinate antiporter
MGRNWKLAVPPLVAALVALAPVPAGLAPHAWRYFAIFAAVIAGLIVEPLPGAAVGLIGVTVAAALGPWVLFGPEQLAAPDFRPSGEALRWALSGFANPTVWLIFTAFLFALGYEKTGLGRRIALWLVKAIGRNALALGYAVMLADLVLAPFTPSNTARSGGTIYPVIRCLPPLYDSRPNDPSARRIGSYLMWVGIASTCVTSALFLTAMAPNLLAVELVRNTVGVEISWGGWFLASAPVAVPLLLLVPLLAYWLYPPAITHNEQVPTWAAAELANLGPLSGREKGLLALVGTALALWVFAGRWIDPALVGLAVVCLMLLVGVIAWDDVLGNRPAWNTLVWFATLVTLGDGLQRVGFAAWFGAAVAARVDGLSPTAALVILTAIFFVVHYLFAGAAAHATALLPVVLAAGTSIPGMNVRALALLLSISLGLMGILTPYGTGPSPVYYGSGYLPARDYWRLGAVFGALYLATLLLVGAPCLLAVL